MSWDKEDIYDEQIAPLMKQIIAICKANEMPMLFTCQYCDTEEDGPGYCSTMLPFDRQSEPMANLNRYWDNQRRAHGSVVLAETHVTNPDGSKEIHIRRVT